MLTTLQMYSQLTRQNIQNFSKICPLEKIQLHGQELVVIVRSKLLYDTLTLFKFHMPYQFSVLTCITGVDYPKHKYRFKLAYDLLSIRFNTRVRIKTFTHELFGVDSCDQLYFTAG